MICFTWLGEAYPQKWQDMTLESFEHENLMQVSAYATALDFITKPCNLILWSNSPSTGKTHLAAALCQFMQRERRWACLFADVYHLLEALRDRNISGIVKQAGSCDLLVLDRLEVVQQYVSELDEILDFRHNRGKPTIITVKTESVAMTEDEITGITPIIGKHATDRLWDWQLGGVTICQMGGLAYQRRS